MDPPLTDICIFHSFYRAPDQIIQYVEEHTAQISTMKGTRHVKPFQDEVDYWEKSLTQISELSDGLLNVQRQWLYMEGIFTSDDVQKQLARETTEFQYINQIWQEEILGKIRENPNALYAATKFNFLDKIQNLLKHFEHIQKKMEDYLETKRSIFPRFYFISNEELVEILSLSRQPELIQIHLKKLFDNIKNLRLLIKKSILANGIISHENEEIHLISTLALEGNVETWLKELEIKMQITVREYLKNCLFALKLQLTKREKWLKDWPSQSCVTASEIEWTSATTKALLTCQADGSLKPLKKLFRSQVSHCTTSNETNFNCFIDQNS
jgi:dynein heavy chain